MLWIYFIEAGADGPIKIGKTGDDPPRRVAQLQVASPFELRLLLAREITGAAVERELHVLFADSRLRGEWFERTPGLLAMIERIRVATKPIAPLADLEDRAVELARHGNWEMGQQLLLDSPLKISPEDELVRR